MSKVRADGLIQIQMEGGEKILAFARTSSSPEEIEAARKPWGDFTFELLRKIFTTDELAHNFYSGYFGDAWDADREKHLYYLRQQINGAVQELRSIRYRLVLFDEIEAVTRGSTPIRPLPVDSRDVFVVHGRDEAAKQMIGRFLEHLELNPVILHEQPDRGRTLIQKFEDHSEVAFAVVLLTPDDEGRLRNSEDDLALRARQNVVFELGYFLGRLPKGHVCALKVEGVEEPSDLRGVLYVPLDFGGAWKAILARELKAAGMDVDMNRAV